MAQFDVYDLGEDDGYVLDVQSDLLRYLDTRVVMPLLRPAAMRSDIARLHPSIEVNDEAFVLGTHLLATVDRTELRERVCSLDANRYGIQGALDVLLTGV